MTETAATLDEAAWRARRAAHEERVDGWLTPHLARRRAGTAHPVEDFLFTYYSHRPARLRRWHPGAGVVLAVALTDELGADYRAAPGGATLDVERLLPRRAGSIAWIRGLLAATAGRAPYLGCFGLHEWAMVYRQSPDEIRHHAWPLRLGPAGTSALVDSQTVRCSHFDAFRFFTPAARPRNTLQPTRQAQPALEQPGCLHANMDLYKYAYKLSPLVASELVADCFVLAREVRELDMRASPYDLSALGYEPVRIETIQGRQRYVEAQRAFAERAAPLRARLLAECDRLLRLADEVTGYDAEMGASQNPQNPPDAQNPHEERAGRRAARLLPEERAAGSDDPDAQAEAILADSEAREHGRSALDPAGDDSIEHRTSEESAT